MGAAYITRGQSRPHLHLLSSQLAVQSKIPSSARSPSRPTTPNPAPLLIPTAPAMVCFSAPKTGSVNIIERFGKFASVRRPGLSVLVPCFGEYKAGTVSLRLQALTVRCETKTKDNVFVNVEVVVQYIVTDAEKFYYKLSDPASQMKAFIFDVIRSLVPNLTLDEVFVSKSELSDAVGMFCAWITALLRLYCLLFAMEYELTAPPFVSFILSPSHARPSAYFLQYPEKQLSDNFESFGLEIKSTPVRFFFTFLLGIFHFPLRSPFLVCSPHTPLFFRVYLPYSLAQHLLPFCLFVSRG